MVTENKPAQ